MQVHCGSALPAVAAVAPPPPPPAVCATVALVCDGDAGVELVLLLVDCMSL